LRETTIDGFVNYKVKPQMTVEDLKTIATPTIAFLALILSVINIINQRKKITLQITINHIQYCNGYFNIEFSVCNTGNIPFTIKEISIESKDSKQKGNSQLVYSSSLTTNATAISEGDFKPFIVSHSGAFDEEKFLEVKLFKNKRFTKLFRLNQFYSYQWTTFILHLIRKCLTDYDVFYDQSIDIVTLGTGQVLVKFFRINKKDTKENICSLIANNPADENQTIIEADLKDDMTNLIIDKLINCYSNILRKEFGERKKKHVIDPDNPEEIFCNKLKYTKEVIDAYGGPSGGQEFFDIYKYNPQEHVQPIILF